MMNNWGWRLCEHTWVWIKRFRHRCGYGVHSPFAFDYITHVIYEKGQYYAYMELEDQLNQEASFRGNEWKRKFPRKVRRLLFRMVNRAQPESVLYVGPDSAAIPFILKAKQQMRFRRMSPEECCKNGIDEMVHFMVFDVEDLSFWLPRLWNVCAEAITPQTVLLVKGVGCNKKNRLCWQQLMDDSRTGISFDLYDWGIVFFDLSMVKQHYVVNF